MRSHDTSSTRGDHIPSISPRYYEISPGHPPLTRKEQMPHPCDALLEHICCPYLPTPQGHCSTPLRRNRIEPNTESPRCLALLKSACQSGNQFVFPRADEAAHLEKCTRVDAVRLSPEHTSQQSDYPTWQSHIHKMTVRRRHNNVLRDDCSQHSDNHSCLSDRRGITQAEEVLLSEEPLVSRKEAPPGKEHSAFVHVGGTRADLGNSLRNNYPKKTQQQRRSHDCSGRTSTSGRAVSDNGGTRSDENLNARVTLTDEDSCCAGQGDHTQSCWAPPRLQAPSIFKSSRSHTAPTRGEDQALPGKCFPHPVTVDGCPSLPCQETFVDGDYGSAAQENKFQEIPPCASKEKKDISTAGLHWHTCDAESPLQARSELPALELEDSTKREDIPSGVGPRPRVRHAFASSAVYKSENSVASFDNSQSPLEKKDTTPQRFLGRSRRETRDGIQTGSFIASQTDYTSSESRVRPSVCTVNRRMKAATRRLRTESASSLRNLAGSSDFTQAHSTRGGSHKYGLSKDHNKANKAHQAEAQRNGTRIQILPPHEEVQPGHLVRSPVKLANCDAPLSSVSKRNDGVTHEQIVALLERCSEISIYGPDVEIGDPSSSPFHSSRQPSISLRDYYFNRIVKYSQMSATDLVMAVVYINKLLKARSPSASTKDTMVEGQQWSRSAKKCTNADTEERHAHPVQNYAKEKVDGTGSPLETASTAFNAHEAVEFNLLTAHRLLLTASLLANKVHYDRHLVLKHWAKLGGLEKEEVVSLEATFLRIIDWRVRVSVEDFALTCTRIALADISLLLKDPATKSRGYIIARCPINSKAAAPADRSRAPQSVENSSRLTRSICCVPSCENKVARAPSKEGNSNGGRSSSIPPLDKLHFHEPPGGTTSVIRPPPRTPPDDQQPNSAQHGHCEKATTQYSNARGKCKGSGHARKAPSDLSVQVTLVETQQASDSRPGCHRLSSPTVRRLAEFHNPSIKSLRERCAGVSVSEQCSSLDACTNAPVFSTEGKALRTSSYASSQFQCVQHKAGIYRGSRRTEPAGAPQPDDRPASGSSESKFTPKRPTSLVMSQKTRLRGGWHPSFRRGSPHTEIRQCTGGSNSVTAAPTHYRYAVTSTVIPPGNCKGPLHVVRAESPAYTTRRRASTEPLIGDTNGHRHDTESACSLSSLNRTSISSSRKSRAGIDSFPKTSYTLEQNLTVATRQMLNTPKPDDERPDNCTGNICRVNRREPTTGYFGGAYETRRTACSAFAPRTTTGYSVDEWKTTTATTIEGISQTEELGTSQSPRTVLNKNPHEQRIQRSRALYFDPQVSCNRFPEHATHCNEFCHNNRAGPAGVGEKALSMRFPPNLEDGLVLPVW